MSTARRPAARRRAARTFRTVALVHRWLGATLFLVALGGTLATMPQLERGTAVERFVEVLALEAEGGGVVNHPLVILLIVAVAALGTALLVRGLVATRGRIRMPRGARGWVREAHRWLGAAFTVSLVAYLAVRAAGLPPGVVGWAWVLLLLAVNTAGIALFVVRPLGRGRQRALSRAVPEVGPGVLVGRRILDEERDGR